MRINKLDLIADLSYSFDNTNIKQNYNLDKLNTKFISLYDHALDRLFEELFSIFDIIRVSDIRMTPYKIHKSYPSARSFYLQKLWIKIDNDKYITKNIKSNKLELYQMNYNDDYDIIITTDIINYPNYFAIHKSLNILEIGHIIYNIKSILDIFNIRFNLKVSKEMILIKLIDQNKMDFCETKLISLKEKFLLRNSGKYYRGIINLNHHFKDAIYDTKINIQNQFFKLFNIEISVDDIFVINFKNNGKYYEYKNLKVEYYELNQIYNYIDFRNSSQYTLLLFKKDIIDKKYLSEVIIFLGYIAQEISLENAHQNKYNRPLKQLLDKKLWKRISSNFNENYIYFYSIVSGFFD